MSQKKKGIILGVILTVFTGVAINFITPFFLGERQSLIYSRFETIPIKEDDGEIAIYHLVIRNDGNTGLDEITVVISFEDAIIEKWNLSIDPTTHYDELDDSGNLNIHISSLNPKD